ncbi:MAG: SufD family Fe-S cluster assembly protein [Candidatus Moraniibacteriota bacterium]
MRFSDISQDKKTHYSLKQNEEACFFMLNRTGQVTFELNAPGAKATILSLFLANEDGHALSVTQKHSAQKTTSHFVGKALVGGTARFNYEGLISIEEKANGSDASQECRNLILSENAGAIAKPALEIKTDEVRCHHAATTSTLSKEATFFAESRGLNESEARGLLVAGFVKSVLEKIPETFSKERTAIEEEVMKKLTKLSL